MNTQLNIRLSKELKELIVKASKRCGISLSGYIRMACIERMWREDDKGKEAKYRAGGSSR